MSDDSGAAPGQTTPEERFARLVDSFAGQSDVAVPQESGRRPFGSSALKVNGSIFAMLTRGQLVVKLPRDRGNASIQDGIGGPFAAGKGTPMKEWLTVTSDNEETWLALAAEVSLAGIQRSVAHT